MFTLTQKWQLGTVFIPDSIGYLVGTNFFGMIAYHWGRYRSAICAVILVGISSILIPTATTMSQLVIPHLGMGLGIGIADAALVPLLATLVDQEDGYGPVYALQQVAVSLAYSLGKSIITYAKVKGQVCAILVVSSTTRSRLQPL